MGVVVRGVYKINASIRLMVSKGSVVNFQGDAIVTAANPECVAGGGVYRAVVEAGGAALAEAMDAMHVIEWDEFHIVRCSVGSAVTTVGGNLDAKHCIHAVGPDYRNCSAEEDMKANDVILRGTYENAMREAQSHRARSVGFALISASVFQGRRSLSKVLEVGVGGIRNQALFATDDTTLTEIHMIGDLDSEVDALLRVCEVVFAVVP